MTESAVIVPSPNNIGFGAKTEPCITLGINRGQKLAAGNMGDRLSVFSREAPFKVCKPVINDRCSAVYGIELYLLTVQTDLAADVRLIIHYIGAAVIIRRDEVGLTGHYRIRFDVGLAHRDIPAVLCGEGNIFDDLVTAYHLIKSPEQMVVVGRDFGNVGIGKHGAFFQNEPCGSVYCSVFACIKYNDSIVVIVRFNYRDFNGVGDIKGISCGDGCRTRSVCCDHGVMIVALRDADDA